MLACSTTFALASTTKYCMSQFLELMLALSLSLPDSISVSLCLSLSLSDECQCAWSSKHAIESESVSYSVWLFATPWSLGFSVHGILQERILEWVAIPFLQGIFPTQILNPGLPHCRNILYHLSYQGKCRTF